MAKDFLSQLFGSVARVKVLRFFLFSANECFTIEDVVKHTKLVKASARKEITAIEKMGLIKKQQCTRTVMTGRGKQRKETQKKVPGWQAQRTHEHFGALNVFLRSTASDAEAGMAGQLKGAGKLRLVVCAGVLCGNSESDVDLLIVADNVNDQKLSAALRAVESGVGHELRYVVFPTDEFHYRLNVYDKLIRNVFDYPHSIVFDTIGVRALT